MGFSLYAEDTAGHDGVEYLAHRHLVGVAEILHGDLAGLVTDTDVEHETVLALAHRFLELDREYVVDLGLLGEVLDELLLFRH